MDHKTSLADSDGTLLLIGAGKMGGAMLEGWHRLGLRFENVVLIEPQPSPAIITLRQRGPRIHPALATFAGSAIVIAGKPQGAPQVAATPAAVVRRGPVV